MLVETVVQRICFGPSHGLGQFAIFLEQFSVHENVLVSLKVPEIKTTEIQRQENVGLPLKPFQN